MLFFLGLIILMFASVIDIKKQEVEWWLLALGVLISITYGLLKFDCLSLAFALLSTVSIPLVLVVLSREKWMGWGDVLFATIAGALSGYPYSLITILCAFLAGSLFGIIYLKVNPSKKNLPFGPFLAFGCLVGIIFGGQILKSLHGLY